MGFWSGLGNVFKSIAPVAASFIPGVGPIIGKAMTTAQKIASGVSTAGSIAGAVAQGREAGRDKETAINSDQDKTRLLADRNYEDALIARGGLDLDQRENTRDAQTDAYLKAMKSALAMNMRDASFNRPKGVADIHLGGGARPSAIGAEGKAAAELMNRQAMDALMNGEQYDTLPELQRSTVTEAPKGSWVDTVLGAAGVAGQAMDRKSSIEQGADNRSLIERILEQANSGGGGGAFPGVRVPQTGPLPGIVSPEEGVRLGKIAADERARAAARTPSFVPNDVSW